MSSRPNAFQTAFSKTGDFLPGGLFLRGSFANALKRRDFKGTAWAALVLSVVLFFYVWQHMQVVQLGYRVEELKSQRRQLLNEYYYLKYRLTDVKSLSRIEKIAREDLKMVTPRSDQIVILPEPESLIPRWLAFGADSSRPEVLR